MLHLRPPFLVLASGENNHSHGSGDFNHSEMLIFAVSAKAETRSACIALSTMVESVATAVEKAEHRIIVRQMTYASNLFID